MFFSFLFIALVSGTLVACGSLLKKLLSNPYQIKIVLSINVCYQWKLDLPTLHKIYFSSMINKTKQKNSKATASHRNESFLLAGKQNDHAGDPLVQDISTIKTLQLICCILFFCLCFRKIVERIDKDNSGKVTEKELNDWIKFTSKRYIYEDVDRQWDQLKKLEQAHMSLDEVYVQKKKADPNEAISWELYKNLTYGYITGEFLLFSTIRGDLRHTLQGIWSFCLSNSYIKMSNMDYCAD